MTGLASELRWPLEKFRQSIEEGCVKQMVLYDEHSAFIWIPNFLKYNLPESPNVVRSWQQSLDYLPECNMKSTLIHHLKQFSLTLSNSFQEALPEVIRKALSNQEQEQEQEQEQFKISLSGKPASQTKTIEIMLIRMIQKLVLK